MQKKLIALAVAGLASTGAFAQSNVTVYGVADATFDVVKVGGDAKNDLGNTTRGIIQIVVTFVTFGIGGIWGFIEGILILVSKPGTKWHQDAAGVELSD